MQKLTLTLFGLIFLVGCGPTNPRFMPADDVEHVGIPELSGVVVKQVDDDKVIVRLTSDKHYYIQVPFKDLKIKEAKKKEFTPEIKIFPLPKDLFGPPSPRDQLMPLFPPDKQA